MTLLENLIQVNGKQGGTIHQYVKNQPIACFQAEHFNLVTIGIIFSTRESLEWLAKKHNVVINWEGN